MAFPYYVEFIILSIIIFCNKGLKFSLKGYSKKQFVLGYVFFIFQSFIIFSLGYDYLKFLEQILLLTAFILFYKVLFSKLSNQVNTIDRYYIKFSFLISCIALFQFALGITQAGRAIVFGGEAGDLSLLLLPAVVWFIRQRKIDGRLAIIFIAFVFAGSAASILALFIIIAIILLPSRKQLKRHLFLCGIICFIVIISLSHISYQIFNKEKSESFIVVRFQATWEALQSGKLDYSDYEAFNASTYAWLVNMKVAYEAPYRLCGTGLGTHHNSYERLYPETNFRFYGLNKDDAYSIFTRVYSELGLVGLLFLFLFIIKNTNRNSSANIMALAYIINSLITGGHYTTTGQVFFYFLLYYTRPRKQKSKKYINNYGFNRSSNIQFSTNFDGLS